MKKNTRLTLRVPSTLKERIEEIAEREGQSAARICEAFLLAGIDGYAKRGRKSLEPLLGRITVRPELE
jgi:predicted transcriptional regulator